MNYLVLGGAGFIGSHIVEELNNGKNFIKVLDVKYKDYTYNQNIDFTVGDINDDKTIEYVLKDTDIVFHTIWTTIPNTSNANIIYDIQSNLISTINLLNKCVENKIKKIIFTSSGGTIYGDITNVSINENDDTNPICSYGITKLAVEKYLYLYYKLYNLDYTILRCSNPFGDGQNYLRNQGLITTLLYRVLKNEEFHIWGDGNVVRDYIYIDDLVDAHIKAANYSGKQKLFNIGFGVGYSINEIIELVNDVLDCNVKVVYKDARQVDVQRNVLNIVRAKSELKWDPQYTVDNGIKETWNWLNATINEVEVLSEVATTSKENK